MARPSSSPTRQISSNELGERSPPSSTYCTRWTCFGIAEVNPANPSISQEDLALLESIWWLAQLGLIPVLVSLDELLVANVVAVMAVFLPPFPFLCLFAVDIFKRPCYEGCNPGHLAVGYVILVALNTVVLGTITNAILFLIIMMSLDHLFLMLVVVLLVLSLVYGKEKSLELFTKYSDTVLIFAIMVGYANIGLVLIPSLYLVLLAMSSCGRVLN